MGLSDKLKQFGDKAKDAAAEHKDQITKAVESAAVVADKRTRGKYTDKIHNATQKTEAYVDRLAPEKGPETPSPGAAAPPSATTGTEPEPPAQV